MVNLFRTIGGPVLVIWVLALLGNTLLSRYVAPILPQWANIPPAPSELGASAAFLGDRELAYRSSVLSLQGFGNSTGQDKALKEYNYDHLGQWLWLGDTLNSRSDYGPFLAAYYFGATQNPDQLYPIIEYLRQIGKDSYGEKWRWLGQAVFLAKHRLKDQKFALDLADELAATYRPGMPLWPRQMRAIIASDMGEKDLAYGMMVEVLKSSSDNMPPAEVNYMLDYICNTILDPVQKSQDALCQGQ